ncbi:hypothetical protein C9374_010866 [Naegleria lovaniensis]|uniref:ARID domain-containing protein n=1 Tax=Naegleria lovaniensis TaxID=51637 RepID=A0AA88GHN0_NAELO|nr:uncharacterized protein C9374_010866 [Naegleria lovaniensis]KAG2374296.1 hypothetical protein C9374_010866 [Naegleria lovaniensis]
MPRKKKSVLEEEEEEDVFGDNEDVDVEERDKFLRDVNEFMEKRGTPIPYDNLPQLGGRRLNVYKLWLQVWSRGGYEAVCENKQWTEVRDAYQVPKTCTSASYSLKMYYQKWLYSYEQVMKLGKADPTQKQTPHVLEQQKKEAASGAVVKKVAPTVKKRVFTSSSSSSTSKSRKTEKEYQPKKKPTTNQNVLNFPQLAQGLQIANIRKHQAEVDHSVLPIESLANAFEHRMNGFYTRTDIDNDEIMKEIEYAKRIYCSLRSDDPSLVEWALYQILRLSENESFRCDHVSDLLEFCENFLLDYACEIEKQNMRDDHDVFNLKDQRYMECQHKAFICITILRNASLIPENRSPIGKSTSLMETLTFYLRYNAKDVIHLDWRLRIMDIIINVSEFIDFSFNTIFAQIVNNTLDTNEEDGLLLSATCLECMNSILKTKTNLPVIETFLMRNPTTLEKVIEFLACPSITKPSDSYFDNDNDKVDEEEEDMNGENKEEFVVENQKLTKVNVTTKLSSLELLCRISALNFLFQLCQSTTNSSLLELLANSASFIDRIVTLIVWKSNLYSRIHQYPYIIFEQVKEHDRENSERTDGNIFAKAANGEKDDSEEYDEKNDMEEMYDGFDSCFASAQDEEKTDTPKISDSLKFQKKCVAILQALGKHTDVLKKSPQFSTYNKEFMYLMLLSHPTISNSLSSVMH